MRCTSYAGALARGASDMSRGGKRPGAGRKPRFTDDEMVGIGARCENLWEEVCRRARDEVDEAIDRARPALRLARAKLKGKTESERRGFIQGRILFQGASYNEHREDVRSAIREDQGPNPPRYVVRRPKGDHRRIIAQVSAETGLSESTVRHCWDRFRVLNRLAEDELDTEYRPPFDSGV